MESSSLEAAGFRKDLRKQRQRLTCQLKKMRPTTLKVKYARAAAKAGCLPLPSCGAARHPDVGSPADWRAPRCCATLALSSLPLSLCLWRIRRLLLHEVRVPSSAGRHRDFIIFTTKRNYRLNSAGNRNVTTFFKNMALCSAELWLALVEAVYSLRFLIYGF